jgi:HEAT repeat protein
MDSNGNPISMPPPDDLTEVEKPTSLLIAQFFLFPLIVIAFGIGIFLLFGYVTFDQKAPEAYLREISQGSGGSPFDTRRWQAALDLSKVIAADSGELRSSGFGDELLRVYSNADSDDPRIRQFLAISLGHLGDPAAVPALIEGLSDTTIETQIWTLWALGAIGDPSAAPSVVTMIGSNDSGVRKIAAYILGTLKDPSTIGDLQVALNDPTADVRWNAAIALAQMNDDAGAAVLLELTDRIYLSQFVDISGEERDNVMVNAVKSLSRLKLEDARGHLASLSQTDPSLSVRDAALEALETY